MSKKFAEQSQLNLSQVNKDVLKKWDENDVFAKSMTEREGCPSFVFYEGPPSANGMPGIHHVMARTIKDTFCRYKTMKGFQVKRKAGWDTHGLPVELGVEKALHITKEDIGKTISVAEYNAYHTSFRNREYLAVYLKFSVSTKEEIKFFMCLVSVKKAGFCSRLE